MTHHFGKNNTSAPLSNKSVCVKALLQKNQLRWKLFSHLLCFCLSIPNDDNASRRGLLHPSLPPRTALSSTATGHWPESLQQQRSQKNYADVPDVNMTYFEALQKPADLAVFLLSWPLACTCLHDMLHTHALRFALLELL